VVNFFLATMFAIRKVDENLDYSGHLSIAWVALFFID
jgi:hypothetical protein